MDLNCDDTSTEAESQVSPFDDDDLRMDRANHRNAENHYAGVRRSAWSNSKGQNGARAKLSLQQIKPVQPPPAYRHTSNAHIKACGMNRDSFSNENSDDDDETTEFTIDDTASIDTEFTQTEITATAATQSVLSSDIDSTTFFDTENDRTEDEGDDGGQFSSITADTTGNTLHVHKINRARKKINHHRAMPAHNFVKHNSLHSSMTSLADSTMSLNIITITLNMDNSNFLGISIVGQSNRGGEGGIYVGSIMAGGAVALDGRIEPGDMILQVNEASFENMSNDEAVKVLREAVMKPG
jgi:hypothetical protein